MADANGSLPALPRRCTGRRNICSRRTKRRWRGRCLRENELPRTWISVDTRAKRHDGLAAVMKPRWVAGSKRATIRLPTSPLRTKKRDAKPSTSSRQALGRRRYNAAGRDAAAIVPQRQNQEPECRRGRSPCPEVVFRTLNDRSSLQA